MKNMENKKKLSPNVIANIIYTLILIITFLLCEWIHFPQQYISFFTFILLGSIVYFVYISVHTQKLLLKKILFLLGLLIIINKLYVPSIFKEKFFINIELGTILIFIIAILTVIFPLFVRAYYWILDKINNGENADMDISNNISGRETKTISPKFENINEPVNTLENISKINIPHYSPTIPNSHKCEANIHRSRISDYIYAALIFMICLIMTYVLVSKITYPIEINLKNIVSNIDFWIPAILFGNLMMVVVFVTLCAYFKLIRVLVQIIRGNDSPFIYAVGLFIISVFMTKMGYFNQDKILNILTQADLFFIPIAALIIYPFFILSANAIDRLLKDKNIYNKMINKACYLSKEVLTIVYSILESLIKLVAFATSNILDSMVELIQSEEMEDD